MNMSNREVVITGMGLVSPLGKNVDENWSNVSSAKTGIIKSAESDRPEFLRYMGQVNEHDIPDDIPPKQIGQMKFLNRGATLGFSATHEAIVGHQDIISETDPGRRAL